MKNTKLTIMGAAFATMAASVAFTGCSSNEQAAEKAEVKSEAKAEQVLRRGNGAEPGSLDPQIVTGSPGIAIQKDLFEGLVAVDDSGKIVPGVAESWNVSEDGKTYTFNLRKTTWTNGTPVTAGDFVYAWQRGVDPATGNDYAFMLEPVKNAKGITSGDIKDINELGIKALDDYTVQVTLENSTPYFLSMLTHPLANPVPAEVVKKLGKEWTKKENIVTNGAFKMSEWVPNSVMELVKSDSYWDKDAVKLDKVIFYPIEDGNTEFKQFRAGELDFTGGVPSEQLKLVKEKYADSYKTYNSSVVYYYGFNTSKAPFKGNLNLRKALSYAVDRKKITDKILKQGQTPAYGMVVPGTNNAKPYVPAYANLSQEERTAQAKELYKKAGYSADKPLKLDILYNTSESHKKIAIAIASMWKETLGVDVNLINQEWKVYLSSRREGNTQVFRAGWGADYNDPNTFLEMWKTGAGFNDVGFKSEKFDGLLEKGAATLDLTARADLLQEAEKEFIDSFAIMPVYYYVSAKLVSPKLNGFTPNVLGNHPSKYMSVK